VNGIVFKEGSLMLLCPYCFEMVTKAAVPCPHCSQFIIDDLINSESSYLDKKNCHFCGKKILQPAKVCRFCHQWLDEIDRAAGDLDLGDLV
jgi:hypothetical protein